MKPNKDAMNELAEVFIDSVNRMKSSDPDYLDKLRELVKNKRLEVQKRNTERNKYQ